MTGRKATTRIEIAGTRRPTPQRPPVAVAALWSGPVSGWKAPLVPVWAKAMAAPRQRVLRGAFQKNMASRRPIPQEAATVPMA